MKIPNDLKRKSSTEEIRKNRHSYWEHAISVGNIAGELGTKPVEQYDTSVNAAAGRQMAVNATVGSQIPAIGLHCTNIMTTVANVELTKRAIVAKSDTLSHLCKPPIFSRNNTTDNFTKQRMKLVKSPETKFNFLIRMTCAVSR